MSVIKSSLINLKGHKLRVFITLIWIIIGITSSILVSSIGNGLKKEVIENLFTEREIIVMVALSGGNFGATSFGCITQ